jgi:transposase-like protein
VASVAAIIATGVNTEGRRLLARLPAQVGKRGRKGVKLVISDAHEGLKAAMPFVFAKNTQAERSKTWPHVVDQLRTLLPTLVALMDEAEGDVLAFPRAH